MPLPILLLILPFLQLRVDFRNIDITNINFELFPFITHYGNILMLLTLFENIQLKYKSLPARR